MTDKQIELWNKTYEQMMAKGFSQYGACCVADWEAARA